MRVWGKQSQALGLPGAYYNENKSEYEGLRTGLFLNESIADKDEDISTKDMWTVDDIDRRTEILANLIVDLYKINNIDIEWFKIE